MCKTIHIVGQKIFIYCSVMKRSLATNPWLYLRFGLHFVEDLHLRSYVRIITQDWNIFVYKPLHL